MTMRGGKREGSGRPKGAINRLSKVAVQRAMALGEDMPLDLMLKYMRGAPGENGKPLLIEQRLKIAEACAPYLHHRLSAIQHKIPDKLPEQTDSSDGDHELPDFRRPER